jgi:ribonuclease-3 family protein
LDRISGILTGEEKQIVKRGRNANPSTVPKNADVTEYRYATGFEALLGYLFLKKKIGRLMEILDKCMPPEENGKTGLDETGETGVDENEKAGLDEPGTTGLGKNGIIVSDESGTVGFGKNK